MCVEDHHIGDDFGQELQHQTSAARYALSVEHNCEDKEEDTRLHRLPLQMLRVEGRILKGNVELEPDRAGRDAAKKKDGEKATYWGLIVLHPNYRWFLISYVVTHCGE